MSETDVTPAPDAAEDSGTSEVEVLDVHDVEAAITQASKTSSDRNYRKVRAGYVVSDKMSKTIVVELEDRKKHPLYGKIMRSTTKVKAHDEANDAGVGDRVLLMETRPLSATKRWRLVNILERAK
jgi:small subunit ribosomal protein S17